MNLSNMIVFLTDRTHLQANMTMNQTPPEEPPLLTACPLNLVWTYHRRTDTANIIPALLKVTDGLVSLWVRFFDFIISWAGWKTGWIALEEAKKKFEDLNANSLLLHIGYFFSGGGGGILIYQLYGYVPLWREWFSSS